MALQFSTMTSAGQFGDSCEFPILDLRPFVNDRVLQNIPRFLYRWEDDHSMRILIDDNYTFVEAETECDFVQASRELLECTVLMPNQEEIMVGESNVKFKQLMRRFCDGIGIVKFPTLFRRDGTLDTGAPLAGRFINFMLSELRGPFMQRLMQSAWTGDQANDNHIAGILTQIEDPATWVDSTRACEYYHANVIDWDAVTDGTGLANPADVVVIANDAYVIKGQTFSGMTGLNLVGFLKMYIERLIEYELARWSDEMIEFELWLPQGQVNCIAELAACMQPCGEDCFNPLSDPTIRARAAEFQKDRVIWLYPYDNHPIKLLTSPNLVNKMVFLPKTVGGQPLVGWVFRDQDQELGIAEGQLPFYGAQDGLPGTTDLYPDNGPIDGGMFEERAFSLHIERNGDCLDFWLKTESAILVFGLHMWLIIDNVTCATLTPRTVPSTEMSHAVTVCAEVDGDTLDLTVPTLDGAPAGTAVGDVWAVHWTEGQMLIGTVDAFSDVTDTVTISFPLAVDCTLGSATNAVASIALIEVV